MTFPLAFAIGFSVASIPGPTIILIATETLRKGAKAGLLTMTAPVLMDALVMLPLGLLLQASLFSGKGSVALVLVGGVVLAWLGFQSIRAGADRFRISDFGFRELDPSTDSLRWTQGLSLSKAGSTLSRLRLSSAACQAERVRPPNSQLKTPRGELPSFIKGVLTHLTSPMPYLYWASVGSSFIRQGFESEGLYGAAIFPLGFWLGACVFTSLIIYVLARGKKLLPPRVEPYLHLVSGALLIGSGVYLAIGAWRGYSF